MSTPIYKLYLMKPKLEAVSLPVEKQGEIMSLMMGWRGELGVRALIAGEVWSDERYLHFGVEWYPSWQVLREYDHHLREINWYNYIQSETFMGVEIPGMPPDLTPHKPGPEDKDGFYCVYISQALPAAYALTPDDEKRLADFRALEGSLGIQTLMMINCRIGNEAWEYFGVQRYPSFEALEQHHAAQYQGQWWKYLRARTYLCTAVDGELIQR